MGEMPRRAGGGVGKWIALASLVLIAGAAFAIYWTVLRDKGHADGAPAVATRPWTCEGSTTRRDFAMIKTSTTKISTTKISTAARAVAGTCAAVALAAVSTGPASAAPVSIPVYQIPSTALAVSGLVVPGPYFATVNVTTTDNPAVVRF